MTIKSLILMAPLYPRNEFYRKDVIFEYQNDYHRRGVRVVGVCVLAVALVSAQLTFSRDWSAGKRASPVAFDCSQFAQICRQFIHDLKQSLGKEKIGKHHKAVRDELAMDYDNDK